MTPEEKHDLLTRWARSDMSFIDISEKLNIPYKKVRGVLGIPAQGTREVFELKLRLLSPDTHLVSIRKAGGKTYLKVEEKGSTTEKEVAELFSGLRAGLQKDAELLSRWARGESLSAIARSERVSRGRLKKRLGLPPSSSAASVRLRLSALAPHLTLLSVDKSDKSSDLLLSIRDTRRDVEFQHTYSWVLKQLKKDPTVVFFPTRNELFEIRVSNGTSRKINGVSMLAYAESLGSSYVTVQKALQGRTEEEAIEILENYERGRSGLELQVETWLAEWGYTDSVQRNKKLKGTPYLPDFVIPECQAVVECDGLYWHSDAMVKDTRYHRKKREAYIAQGYRPFFLRENEINQKPEVCKSILANFLGRNRRIFARKTKAVKGDASLIENNHLMGKGKGRVYSLEYKGEVVSSLQVKFLSLKDRVLDVSRFCTAPGVSVVGGFSKLIAHAVKEEKPSKVQTFVDLRYGSGEYLTKLGWSLVSSNLSFAWTNMRGEAYHRMKFPGNTGYDKGLAKIWDCGQAKWEIAV